MRDRGRLGTLGTLRLAWLPATISTGGCAVGLESRAVTLPLDGGPARRCLPPRPPPTPPGLSLRAVLLEPDTVCRWYEGTSCADDEMRDHPSLSP